MAALFGTTDLYRVSEMDHFNLPILEEWAGTHGPLALRRPQKSADPKVVSSSGVAAQDWTAWYEKALTALGPGGIRSDCALAHMTTNARATFRSRRLGRAWRQHDFDTVKSAEFQKFLKDQGFVLVGWKDLQSAARDYGKISIQLGKYVKNSIHIGMMWD